MSREIADPNPHRANGATRKRAQRAHAAVDSIDLFMQQWRRERPDIDTDSFGVLGRIHRILGYFDRRANGWLAQFGLTWETFSLIVTLRRAGKPYALRPTDLLQESLLSSGAMTNRIDRVEQIGLVRRVPDPTDRRGVVVQLTPRGRTLADRAVKIHFEEMSRLLTGLTASERRTMAGLLRTLLVSFERAGKRPKSNGANGHKPRTRPSSRG